MTTPPGHAPVVFVDADNTLWDTDRVFADAQTALLDEVERLTGTRATADDRLGFVRAIDQAIASRHHDGLRYPPAILAQALALALGGAPATTAAKAARLGGPGAPLPTASVAVAEATYVDRLGRRPVPRPGVAAGLARLAGAGCEIIVVSEAARAKVEGTAVALGLADRLSRVVEGRKRPELYTRTLRLLGAPTAHMVGDQLDRDIAPAKAAGLTTIYFPGGFAPSWTPDEADVAPDFRIAGFDEVPRIVLGTVRDGAATAGGVGKWPDGRAGSGPARR